MHLPYDSRKIKRLKFGLLPETVHIRKTAFRSPQQIIFRSTHLPGTGRQEGGKIPGLTISWVSHFIKLYKTPGFDVVVAI